MSILKVDAIANESGNGQPNFPYGLNTSGTNSTINGFTPTVSNMAGRNRIINGDMRIDQRNAGAAITIHNSHPVDRFKNGFANMSTGTFTSQQSTTAPDGFTSSVVYTAGAADSLTANSYAFLLYHIEGYDFADMNFGATSAKTVTLSFWARSSLTGLFGVALRNGPPYDRSYIASYTISSANTWEYKTITIPGCTTGTWDKSNGIGASVFFDLGVGTTYSGSATGAWENANLFGLTGGIKIQQTAGATLYITGVQLEAGSVATPFEYRQYGQELALCQRYFWRTTGDDFAGIGSGSVRDSTSARAVTVNPTTMRAKPSISIAGTLRGSAGGSNLTITSIAASWSGVVSNMTEFVVSGATAGQGFIVHHLDNTSNYFQCDAEL